MKKQILILLAFILGLSSCIQEKPIPAVADFTTSLSGTTVFAGEVFYLYLDQCSGEFLTLYDGRTNSTTYVADSIKKGTDIGFDEDSIEMFYNAEGEYKLTLIASSSGNWASEYEEDVEEMTFTVVDNRTALTKLEVRVDGEYRQGVITGDNEVIFTAHRLEDLSNCRVKFGTASPLAKVYVDGVEQETGRNDHDFSPVNPSDDEGRPVEYKVVSATGDEEIYVAKFQLHDPDTQKKLYAITAEDFNASFAVDTVAKSVLVSYYEGESLSGKVTVAASLLASSVKVDGSEVLGGGNADFSGAPDIVVTAQDLSTATYTSSLYEKEKITAFNFTAFDAGSGSEALNPPLIGTVNFAARTIDVEVFGGLNLSKIVATFSGITDFTVKIGSTTLTSGVTEFDYSLGSGNTSKTFNVDVYDGTKKIDTYTLTVHQ